MEMNIVWMLCLSDLSKLQHAQWGCKVGALVKFFHQNLSSETIHSQDKCGQKMS